jgi:hypothetical protein
MIGDQEADVLAMQNAEQVIEMHRGWTRIKNRLRFGECGYMMVT